MRHTFHQSLTWDHHRNTVGKVVIADHQLEFSIPAALDGPGRGTNPDELLLSSAAGCYIMTLGAMFERSQIAHADIELRSELVVEVEDGIYRVSELHHYPTILNYPHEKKKILERLVHKADERCMISNALKGSVKIMVHPTFQEEHHENSPI
ncbi:OsmC family protein [Chryseomicrobium sp. FSL W7-1435]|uniref:OsmC family protein n=1 Tax=Chryseomicrobium sp. FSL W7-1435 TaxID=2921704 RepID=UPI003159F736